MTFNWQQKGWPKATVNTAALRDELDAFKVALRYAKKLLGTPQGPGAEAGPVRGVPTMPPAPPSIIVRPEHGACMGDQTAEDFARMASAMLH